MKTISFILFYLLLSLSGCISKISDKLIDTVDHNCISKAGMKCRISFQGLTPFQWNKLYFFRSWTTASEIQKIIGSNYNGNDVQDDYTRMLFINNGKIVYEEDFISLSYDKSVIIFPELIDNFSKVNSVIFTPNNSTFIVDKSKITDGCETCYQYSISMIK